MIDRDIVDFQDLWDTLYLKIDVQQDMKTPLFSVYGTLNILGEVFLMHSYSDSFTFSFFAVLDGSATLSGMKIDQTSPISFADQSLIEQTSGSLILTLVEFNYITKQTGDGSMLSSALKQLSDVLRITQCTFNFCSSNEGNGGAISLTCTSSVRPSNIVIKASFLDTFCQSGRLGEWVFLQAYNFSTFIIPANWEGTFSSLQSPDDDNKLWGFDLAEQTIPPASFSLLPYLFNVKTYEQITVDRNSRFGGVGVCGRDEGLPCRTVDESFNQRTSDSVEIVVVDSAQLNGTVFATSVTLSICSSHPSQSSELEVDGTGTVPPVGWLKGSSSSITLSTLQLTLPSAKSSLLSALIIASSTDSSSFVATPFTVEGGVSHDFTDVQIDTPIPTFNERDETEKCNECGSVTADIRDSTHYELGSDKAGTDPSLKF
ncbi:hypothetical protein BLNAU_18381 [Blattamonas nauphoetae]|uniref:Uncharacterized protein n=1 Tax=Blattamonas nauphoetae TaxID=2049346 RepID=A0ABQ9X4K0_9EUKA|nr:hypothetical protein BLNAU_18381 [Blattamonas nauphoetae]